MQNLYAMHSFLRLPAPNLLTRLHDDPKVISVYYEPEPGVDRRAQYYDDPPSSESSWRWSGRCAGFLSATGSLGCWSIPISLLMQPGRASGGCAPCTQRASSSVLAAMH